jgi:hypothetical protein
MEGAILQPLPRIRRFLVTGGAALHKKETSTTIQYQLMGSRFTFTSFCQSSSYRIKPNKILPSLTVTVTVVWRSMAPPPNELQMFSRS